MRVIGVDLGARRIGIAVSDPTGVLASPVTTVERSGDPAADHRALARLVEEYDAERVVVGLPLSLNGGDGPAATAVRDEVATMGEVIGVPVELWDERFTTVSAHRALHAAGVASRDRRRVVDRAAAAVMLQAWLDRTPKPSAPPSGSR